MAKGKKEYTYHRGSVTVGVNPDGTPHRVFLIGRTPEELAMRIAEVKRKFGLGLEIGDTTVREWAARWMAVYKANASDTQKAHYDAKLRHDILPAIGNMRMRDVRRSHLQELLNAYRGGKLETVKKIRQALCQLFRDAGIEGVIERDPSVRLELPALTEDRRRPLTPEERKTVLAVAETHPRGAYVLMMLYCGLRRGECIALERGDIDLDKRRVTVSKSLSLQKNVGTVKTPKTAAGARVVPIPDVLMPSVSKACEGKPDGDLMFPKGDGAHATKMTCTWWWNSFARECHIAAGARLYRSAVQYDTSPFGQEVTPHFLRHTYATDIYAAGVDEKTRKYILGHSSNDVTDTYTAMSDAALDRAAVLINSYYNSDNNAK